MSQTKVQLKNVRLSFPKLFKPDTFNGEGTPKYGAAFLIDPSTPEGADNIKRLKAAANAAAEAKWGKGKIPKLKADRQGLKDGDESEYDGYAGMQVATGADVRPPVLLDRDKSPLNEATCMAENKLYAGCYVDVLLNFWAQDNSYGKRLNANLRAVRFREHGDEFSGVEKVNLDEFDDLEGDAATGNDDFDL